MCGPFRSHRHWLIREIWLIFWVQYYKAKRICLSCSTQVTNTTRTSSLVTAKEKKKKKSMVIDIRDPRVVEYVPLPDRYHMETACSCTCTSKCCCSCYDYCRHCTSHHPDPVQTLKQCTSDSHRQALASALHCNIPHESWIQRSAVARSLISVMTIILSPSSSLLLWIWWKCARLTLLVAHLSALQSVKRSAIGTSCSKKSCILRSSLSWGKVQSSFPGLLHTRPRQVDQRLGTTPSRNPVLARPVRARKHKVLWCHSVEYPSPSAPPHPHPVSV